MTRPEQYVLDLPVRTARGAGDFLVAASNQLAVDAIDTWPDWPAGKLALSGEEGAGKTHLVHVWAERSDATILQATDIGDGAVGHVAVENVDRIAALALGAKVEAERALFHLHNRVREAGDTLLLTGIGAPARWKIDLPDLKSRLQAATAVSIEAPDDQLLASVIVKLFADRQVAVGPDLVDYLLARIDRSMAAAEAMVVRLDKAGLSRKRAVTRRLAAEILADSPSG